MINDVREKIKNEFYCCHETKKISSKELTCKKNKNLETETKTLKLKKQSIYKYI